MAIIPVPQTSPAPTPIQIFMPTSTQSSAPPPPESTPLPPGQEPDSDSNSTEVLADGSKGPKYPTFTKPTLRLEIRDLSHPGASKFLAAINAAPVLERAVSNVQHLLYHPDGLPTSSSAFSSSSTIQLPTPTPTTTQPHHPHAPIPVPTPTTKPVPDKFHCPPTRSVTIILRDMPGVAYTTGVELDPTHHKEIHFSLWYISNIPAERVDHEITGVLTHELVHCYQWNGQDACPGGLIEGVADWVRLRCGLSPPHWKRDVGEPPKKGKDGDTDEDKEREKYKWDRGYQHTAYFLEYLEKRFGKGTVRRLNEGLRREKYQEKRFWDAVLGKSVERLWEDYVKAVRDGDVLCL